jgi:hypothetical protein
MGKRSTVTTDGHHRAAAAVARGDKRITVRVLRPGDQ